MKKDLAALLQNNPEFDLSICKILNEKQLESLENNIVLFLHGKTLDMGTKDLSILLLKELLCTLSQQELLPKTIILSQKTVLCNQRESEFLHFFRLLEQKNIEILTCKTSAEYYKINRNIPIGRFATMEEIIEKLFHASKIIQW
ncbi:MAG TPA: hypothetical protein VIG61_07225 [Fusobacterium sp.]|uniref:hypothetical protein n=1 Tax=Fusobacterium sp. TaxID=68766 RepID=UPI002F4300DC